MGKIKITAKIVDRGAARGFRAGARDLGKIIRTEFERELGPRLLRVSRQSAPEKTGALQRGLRFELASNGLVVDVRSTVRSKEGFPYTGVTRFGHRSRWIYPTTKKALAFTIDGKRFVRRRVRGYHPSHDWGYDAYVAAKPHVDRSAQRIGRELAVKIG